MGLSIRSYAKHRGVSHVAVLRAIKSGRIIVDSGGTIDPVKADVAWAQSTTPPVSEPAPPADKGLKPIAEAAVGSVRETLKEQGLPTAGAVSFVQARTAHEIAKAHLARLRLQKLKGELVEKAAATALVFRLAREERDSWLNWPARSAALMAAELGLDTHSLQSALETHVRRHLAELAEIRAEFR